MLAILAPGSSHHRWCSGSGGCHQGTQAPAPSWKIVRVALSTHTVRLPITEHLCQGTSENVHINLHCLQHPPIAAGTGDSFRNPGVVSLPLQEAAVWVSTALLPGSPSSRVSMAPQSPLWPSQGSRLAEGGPAQNSCVVFLLSKEQIQNVTFRALEEGVSSYRGMLHPGVLEGHQSCSQEACVCWVTLKSDGHCMSSPSSRSCSKC